MRLRGGVHDGGKAPEALVGALMRDKELLEMRIARFEGELPFLMRRSNP